MVKSLESHEWPMAGIRHVKKTTYVTEYHELTKKNARPPRPHSFLRGLGKTVLAAFILLAVAASLCTSVRLSYRPPGPDHNPTAPKPDYFFLWLYGLLSYCRPPWDASLLIGQLVGYRVFVLLPFLLEKGRKVAPRPIAVLTRSG